MVNYDASNKNITEVLKYIKNSSISKLRAQDIILDSENKAKWKKRCPV